MTRINYAKQAAGRTPSSNTKIKRIVAAAKKRGKTK